MRTQDGTLSFDAAITDVNFRSTLDAMERRVMGFTSTTIRETSRVDDTFKRLGQAAAGYFSFQALTELPGQILRVRSEFQSLEIAFSTMLRSKTKADTLLASLAETAATTPFGLKDIAAGAKQLLAYGSASENVVKEIRTLGDVASGVGAPIQELIYLYGTLRTQGRAYAVDIRQFAGRGIPIYAELAKVLGVNVDQVNKFVESGKVGFKEVEQAFKNMTSSGGLFAGLMDAQSKSLLGLKERLGDAWDLMLNEIGKKNEGVATELLQTTSLVIENYQSVIDILKIAATTYGTYKAALLLVSVAQRAQLILLQSVALEQGLAAAAGEVLTAQQARQIVVSKLLQRAQASLNATMLANPYVLVASALAGLVTAYFVLREEAIEVKSAQELMANSTRETLTNFRSQSGEIKNLIGVIQNQNIAESERLKAYDKLKSVAPDILQGLDFQRAKTADLTKELNQYLISLEKKIRLESASSALKTAYEQDTEAAERLKKAQDDLIATSKSTSGNNLLLPGVTTANGQQGGISRVDNAKNELNKALDVKKKTQAVVDQINQSITGIYTGGNKDGINAEISRLQLVQSTIKDKLSPAYKDAEDKIKNLTAQRDALTQAETKGAKAAATTVEQYNDQIKALKEQQAQNSTSRSEYVAFQAKIDALTKSRNRLTGEMTASEKKAAKDADKVGPYGSLSYWENISQKAKEIRDKTPDSNTGKIAKQNAIILDADKKAEALRKKYAILSFDDELTQKREKYVLYQQWVDAYGQAAADKQFGSLIQSGQSYVDYLNSQIALLEKKREGGQLGEDDSKNLGSLLTQRDEATGKKTAIEAFNDSLQAAQRNASSLSDYLDVLKQKQSELNPNDNSSSGIQIRKNLAEEVVGTENELRGRLTQFLQSVNGSEDQALAIHKNYADLRTGLDKQYNDKRSRGYQTALATINKAEKQELEQFQQMKLEQTEEYRNLTKVIMEEGLKGLRIQIANQQAVVDKAKDLFGVNSEVYKKAQKDLNEMQKQLSEGVISNINQFAGLAGQLGSALVELGGSAAEGGQALISLANTVPLVASAFKKGITDTEKYSIAIQGAIQLFTSITSAAAQRKKAESDYYAAIIAQQSQYNLLLNEQMGIQTKSKENIFVKDYLGELSDGFRQFDDAQQKYQESLRKLNEGRAKSGLANSFSASNFLSSVGAGAAIGSIIPGIGTAVGGVAGAVVGGIVGLFSSNKKVDEFGSLLALYPGLVQKTASGVDELNTALAESLIAQGQVDDETKALLQSTIDWQKQVEAARASIKAILSDLVGALGDKLRDNLVGAFRDGTDAALAFKSAVSGILEDLVTKMLFSQAFNQLFTQLQTDLAKSLDVQSGGDGNTIDDFERFTENSKGALDQYNQWLQQFQDAAKKSGFNVLSPSSTSTSGNSIQGAIKGVTESTADILAGQMNAIRITQADTNGVIRQQLLVLTNIDRNTARLEQTNKSLDNIDRSLQTIASDPLRGVGGVPR